ncbi:MAG: hypothetical protein OEZ39_19680 [Gammaproteobacteria bacterium]|nr:hypothetical protein [Gammaproteobacteria bacterium]MDH5654088.1 hypothetical protein [Gammaproteobacteria bacterium]
MLVVEGIAGEKARYTVNVEHVESPILANPVVKPEEDVTALDDSAMDLQQCFRQEMLFF